VVKALGLQTALEIVLNLVNLRDLQIVELGLSNLICVVSLLIYLSLLKVLRILGNIHWLRKIILKLIMNLILNLILIQILLVLIKLMVLL
jgi:hypothetical protein